jgi:hypothetical protein
MRVTALLKEKEAAYKPIPGWDDPPAENGDGFKDEIPF